MVDCIVMTLAAARSTQSRHNPNFIQSHQLTTAAMDPQYVEEKKQEVAQEMFDKKFEELEPHDRIRVGGKVGGGLRGGDLADPDRAPDLPAVKFGEDNEAPGDDKKQQQA